MIPNFLDNHDQSRFLATGAGDAQARNAIVANHLIAGIPTAYYGTEQEIKEGAEDPFNRNALWKHNGYSTSTGYYRLYQKLNQIRKSLGSGTQFHNTVGRTVAVTDNDIAIQRNNVLIVLTKVLSSGPLNLTQEPMLTEGRRGVMADRALGESAVLPLPPTRRFTSKPIIPFYSRSRQADSKAVS